MKLFAALVVVLAFSLTTFAQVILTGTVYDPTGAVIAGAQVKAVGEKHGTIVGVSDRNGLFSLELTPGIYSIQVSAQGFLTIEYSEYLVIKTSKMVWDAVMLGAYEPCRDTGADCLPSNLLIKSYKIEHSPKLRKLRDYFAPATRPQHLQHL